MGRPVLIDKSLLKPKITTDLTVNPTAPSTKPEALFVKQYTTPSVVDVTNTPYISFKYFKPEMDNQSISILVNLTFFTILTFGGLWIYNLYLDRLDTKITTVQELGNQTFNQPLIINNGPIIPSNLTDVPEEYNYI